MNEKKGSEQHGAEDIRTFICIEIPESIKERIAQLQEMLRQVDAQVSWTRPSNIHLTLRFLGGVPASRIERIGQAVERAANCVRPFQVEVSGTGCFPSPRSPRVLWVGCSSVPEGLQELCANIDNELARVGFARENQKFSPHLTIGRLRASRNAGLLAEQLNMVGFEPENFEAQEIIVMRSNLKPAGSIYTPQATIKLDTGTLTKIKSYE